MKSSTANKTAFGTSATLTFLVIVALLSYHHLSQLAVAMAIVSSGLVAWVIHREMMGRQQAEARLHGAQLELEDRVAARTAEINRACVALQAEGLERQRAEEALRRAHDELEVHVAERTRALADANHLLRREIVERRQMAEALKNSRTFYHSLVAHLPVHVWRTDVSGRFTFVNVHLCESLGITPEDCLGKTVFDFYTRATAERNARDDRAVLESGEPHEEVQEFETRTGRQGFEQVLKTPFHDADGRVLGVQGISWDVTERKRAEEEMRRIQTQLERTNSDLRRKNEEVQNFCHILSHELKAPLTAAREFISLVLDGLAGGLNDTQKEYLRIGRESCDQLCVCINDLFDASRLETGKLTLDLKPASLGALVQRVVTTLRPVAQSRRIDLNCEVQAGLGDIHLDDHRVTQVLSNLLHNALKFTEPGGRIVARVSPSAEQADSLEVSVCDTGRGIPLGQQERIFERLYQIKTGEATTDQGLGLGLYLCRELVRLHGGDIWVESEAGLGSVFTFTLPQRLLAPRANRLLAVEEDDRSARDRTATADRPPPGAAPSQPRPAVQENACPSTG